MHTKNLSQFISWDIKSFLLIIFSIQLAVLGSIGLDVIGLKIPIIRQLIGFIYLSFVPGILIVRLLNLKNINNIETLLYTIGLSISTLMFTGFFINIVGLHFVANPISTIYLISAISFIIVILSYLCYRYDNKTTYSHKYEISNIKNSFFSLPTLFLISIPFLSVFGTYMVNYYNNNFLLLLLILIICVVMLLVGFNTKFIPKDHYPLAIFVIAISLLLHNSLIFPFLYGWDVHEEYYYSNFVKIYGFWNMNFPKNVNAMLSVVFLAPIYSDICNLTLTWVFKIIYPLLFSFLPLGLFHIYKKETENDVTAFLSVIYFMSISTFYTEILALERQQIAELFFVILISIFICNLKLSTKRLLALIFTFSLVVSHYGLSYLILFLIIVGYGFSKYILKSKSDIFRPEFILIFFIFAISWYMYSSNGSLFRQVVLLFSHYYDVMFDEVLVTKSTQFIVSKSFTFWGGVLKILYIISQIFIVAGFLYIVSNSKKLKFSKEYISFSFILLVALGSTLVYSNTGMNLHRIYHIASILLAVYCIIGGNLVFSTVNKLLNNLTPYQINSTKILTLFLVLFLLINIGFIQEISKNDPISISISHNSLKIDNKSDNIYDKLFSLRSVYRNYVPEQDYYGITWLSKYKNSNDYIYADITAKNFGFVSYGMMPYFLDPYSSIIHELSDPSSIEPDAYVYLKYINIIYGLVSNGLTSEKENAYLYTSEYLNKLSQKDKIYTNGANWILK